eukprot:SAG22_NODE_3744_length_1547_cov_1.741022_2_plen_106_part_00
MIAGPLRLGLAGVLRLVLGDQLGLRRGPLGVAAGEQLAQTEARGNKAGLGFELLDHVVSPRHPFVVNALDVGVLAEAFEPHPCLVFRELLLPLLCGLACSGRRPQ